MVGLIILTINQGLDANSAMPWFMLNEVAPVVTVMIFILVFAAGMSSADSNLNAAAILITNDLVKTIQKKMRWMMLN